jgi:hypothetical protein
MHSTPFTRPMPPPPPQPARVLVHFPGSELREFEETGARIEQAVDAVARQQLAAREMLGARLLAAAPCRQRRLFAQVGDAGLHGGGVGLELFAARVEFGFDD